MRSKHRSETEIQYRAKLAMREALVRFAPSLKVDDDGYIEHFSDNLLLGVVPEDFEADLRQGNGGELRTKFRAAHSSSALTVNSFAPFRRRIADLKLFDDSTFEWLRFERKCPTGLPGGQPNLDVLLPGPNGSVGIESKLTEHFGKQLAKFSPNYRDKIQDTRRNQG